MDKMDRRSGYTRANFVTEAKPEEKALVIRGYAILVDEPTEIWDKRNGF